MGRRKLGDQNIRKLLKKGNGSVVVTLPIEIVRALGWRDGQKVIVKKAGEGISIVDWKK